MFRPKGIGITDAKQGMVNRRFCIFRIYFLVITCLPDCLPADICFSFFEFYAGRLSIGSKETIYNKCITNVVLVDYFVKHYIALIQCGTIPTMRKTNNLLI